MLKLHCLLVCKHSLSWLYAFFRSRLLNQTRPLDFSEIWRAMLSISSWMFGIWYLFLKIWSFNNLESNASLIEVSFFRVITIGLIKQSSSHFSNFIIWPSVSILFNSSFTPASKWSGTLLPLDCIGLKDEWKCVTFRSLGIFPTLMNSSSNSLKILSDKEGKFLYSQSGLVDHADWLGAFPLCHFYAQLG